MERTSRGAHEECTSDILPVPSLLLGSDNSAERERNFVCANETSQSAVVCCHGHSSDEICRLDFAPLPNLVVDILTALNERDEPPHSAPSCC